MRRSVKRLFSVALALTMLFSLFPATVTAQEAAEAVEAVTETEVAEAVTVLEATAVSDDGEAEASDEASEQGETYRDGTYSGTGEGFGGEISVEVTITGGKITSVVSPSHDGETYWTAYDVDQLLARIVEANSVDVDGVTGATRSSNGVKEAVRNALRNAVDTNGAFDSGSGTRADPYVIMTAEQLSAFAAYVDGGESCEGQYVVLGADLNLSGQNWNPIGFEGAFTGDQSALFNGNFDGQGHAVSGLTCRRSVDDEANIGFFSVLNTEACVQNVRLEDVSISVTGTASGKRVRAGGVAGATVGNTRERTAIIDNCLVSGEISVTTDNAMGYAAGIVGQLNGGGAVINCVSRANIASYGTGSAGRPYVGGITANNGNNSVIVNCAVTGSLSSNGQESSGYIGGLGGMLTGVVENCLTEADVLLSGDSAMNAGLVSGMMLTDSSMLYYAGDAALSIGGNAADAQPYGMNNVGAEAVSMTKSDLHAAAFAETLNGNLYNTFKALDKEALPLRLWVYDADGVIPAGEVWINDTPDSSAFDSGSGTQDDPYVIMTEEQLRTFAGDLSDSLDYDGLFVALGADVTLTQGDWTPVGGSSYAFEGTFDGQGHTIRGLTLGSADMPAALDEDTIYIGLFGVLGSHACVKDVNLSDVAVYVTASANTRLGGIAGMLYATDEGADNYAGAVIDGCSVSGVLSLAQANGNAWAGGIAAYQYRGAIVNCWTDVKISCLTASTDTDRKYFAEAGGLTGLNNRGLTANCYALGNVTAGADQSGGDQSEAVAGALIGCNAGALSGSYASGNVTALGTSSYTGMISGWITGIGKAYNCFYNHDAVMTVNGTALSPAAVGTLVPGGKSDEGLVYTGGVTDKLDSYIASTYTAIAGVLNGYFAAYPIDVTSFGMASDALRMWTEQNGVVTFADTTAESVYVQPEAEKITPEAPRPQDGVWYGRDANQTVTVRIHVSQGEITATDILSGTEADEGYAEAVELAAIKASIGDATTYDAADTSRFGGGAGTQTQPYLISNEEQLRYLAASINRDVDWKGVWFRQSADIALSGEFLPIGWAREYFDSAEQEWITFAYPFSGSYDGGGYAISGLSIGSESAPSNYMAAGLFGLTEGEYNTNEEPSDEQNVVRIRNVVLKDAAIYVSGHQTYVGGLIGIGQNGILVDRCGVTGSVCSYTTDSFSRAGGLAGNLLRGRLADCWTDTDTYAHSTQGSSYSGALCAMSNRIAMLNCYTLGTTRAYADSNERAYAGGISAFAGELKYNVYAYGDVIAESVSNAVGGINGLVGGITKEEKVYFNTEAGQSSGGTAKAENSSHGLNYVEMAEDIGYTAAQFKSADFAAELNANLDALPDFLNRIRDSLGFPVYYHGNGSDLHRWTLLSGDIVGFMDMDASVTGTPTPIPTSNATSTPVPTDSTTPTPAPTGSVTPTSSVTPVPTPTPGGNGGGAQQGGCYVATAVYGSYDCPKVWTLRRFRDEVLAETWYGRLFIRLYYAVSPTAVKLFGESEWFQNFFRARLDKMVSGLQAEGFASTPYQDQAW